jgi:hypothetical protein
MSRANIWKMRAKTLEKLKNCRFCGKKKGENCRFYGEQRSQAGEKRENRRTCRFWGMGFWEILEILEIRMSEGAAETPGWGPTTTILVKTLFLLDFFFFCRAGEGFTLPHSPLCR